MFRDIILMKRGISTEDLARELGFSKLYFKEDIKDFQMEYLADYDKKRDYIKRNKIKILLNPHLVSKKDSLHFRNSGLDHILCKMMNEGSIAMAVSLDKISNYVEIGRIKQNIRLCRKYNVKMLFFTFADNIYSLRARLDILAFLEVLGMTPGEAKNALINSKTL